MQTRPNIIFYFSDQQRYDTMGCYGQPLAVTPHLDALAATGTVFEQAYSCQPVCGPARACLQSGLYPTQVNGHRNGLALPQDITTLADHFANNGYQTAYVGKWHLASTIERYGLPPTETEYTYRAIPPEHRGGYRDYWMASDLLEFTSHGYDGHLWDGDGKKHEFIGYRADAINNYAIHYLQNKQGDEPFFMFISQIEPHHQNDRNCYEGPDGSREAFKDYVAPADLPKGQGDWEKNYPDYLGQCHSLDQNVGRLVDTLKAKGMWENTILIYTSDHGSHFCTRNDEYKRSCHDASTHIPLLAIGGPFEGGKRIEQIVSMMDLPRTLLDCAGIAAPDHWQGRSLKSLVEGNEPDWENCAYIQISESQVGRAIRTADWKYGVVATEADGWEDATADCYTEMYLYDLKADPTEWNNLVADPKYKEVRAQLCETLKACMAKAKEPIPEILPVALTR